MKKTKATNPAVAMVPTVVEVKHCVHCPKFQYDPKKKKDMCLNSNKVLNPKDIIPSWCEHIVRK